MDKQTTTIVLVAAVAVGAVWYMTRQRTMRYSGGAGYSPAAGGLTAAELEAAGKGLSGIITAVGGLFSGSSSASTQTHSSDPNVASGEQTTFVGQSCSADYNCGFGESCVNGMCLPSSSSSDSFATV